MCDRIGILNKGNLLLLIQQKILLNKIQTKKVNLKLNKKKILNKNEFKFIKNYCQIRK